MRSRALFLIALLIAIPLAADDAGSTIVVRQLEVGYRLGDSGALRTRVTLATGEAIEFTTTSAEEAKTVLELAELFSSGRVEMTATVEDKKIKSLQCAVRR